VNFLALFGLTPATPLVEAPTALPPYDVSPVIQIAPNASERVTPETLTAREPDLIGRLAEAHAATFAATGCERAAMTAALTTLRWADLRQAARSPTGRRASAKAARRIQRTLDDILIAAQFGAGP